MSGTLFIVATPIGNLDDLSPRARHTLETADLIAAEDTRHSKRLLSHFGIKTPVMALHEHNEARAVPVLLSRLESGDSVALISDAGTPLVSDPGYRLVSRARAAGLIVTPVPGASAMTAALSVAGLPTDRICFEGFLPSRPQARRTRISELRNEARTIVLYESVHRIAECLDDLAASFGDERQAFMGRELTKIHEQCILASLGELCSMIGRGAIAKKGEFVLVVSGSKSSGPVTVDIDVLLKALASALSARDAARIAAEATGEKRNELYRRLLELGADPKKR